MIADARAEPASAPAALLTATWEAWVLENLALGAPPAEVAAGLVEAGVPAALAAEAVRRVQGGPLFATALRLADGARRARAVLALQADLQRAVGPLEVPRLPDLTGPAFLRDHYAANRPVVLTGLLADWPAVGRWGPAWFAERYGAVEVEVCSGRAGAAHPDRDFADHVEQTTLGAFSAWVAGAGLSNDRYLIARNFALARPELQPLLDDIRWPAALVDPARRGGSLSLWFGPAGTRTPLHHDGCNILFCQVTGRKRVTLAPPCALPLLDTAQGFYAAPGALAQVDPALVATVDLRAGEALFIPVGWWHAVEALEVSVNLSFLGFRPRNRFDDYRPGVAPRASADGRVAGPAPR